MREGEKLPESKAAGDQGEEEGGGGAVGRANTKESEEEEAERPLEGGETEKESPWETQTTLPPASLRPPLPLALHPESVHPSPSVCLARNHTHTHTLLEKRPPLKKGNNLSDNRCVFACVRACVSECVCACVCEHA